MLYDYTLIMLASAAGWCPLLASVVVVETLVRRPCFFEVRSAAVTAGRAANRGQGDGGTRVGQRIPSRDPWTRYAGQFTRNFRCTSTLREPLLLWGYIGLPLLFSAHFSTQYEMALKETLYVSV